jgi:hypothetical protein
VANLLEFPLEITEADVARRMALDIETRDAVEFLQRRGHVVILKGRSAGITTAAAAIWDRQVRERASKRPLAAIAALASLQSPLSPVDAIVGLPNHGGFGYPWDRDPPSKAQWHHGSESWQYPDARWCHAIVEPNPNCWPEQWRWTSFRADHILHCCRVQCGTLHARRDQRPLAAVLLAHPYQ